MAISLVPKSIASPEDEQQKMMQAMAANRRNANLPAPTLRREPGPMEQLGNMAKQRAMQKGVAKGEELVTEYGGKAIDYGKEALGFGTPGPLAPATPSATQMTALQSVAPTASAPMAPAATMGVSPGAAQAVLGSGSSAAPAVANAAGMTGTQLAGTTAAELAAGKMAEQAALGGVTGGATTGATTGALTNAATAGAGGGGMLASAGAAMPYVGAALLADEVLGLGIRKNVLGFNKGGFVNPLYKANGGAAMGFGPLALQAMKENRIKTPGLLGLAMMSAGGPVNQVEYKGDGGEVKISYGGPLSNRE